MYPIIKVSGSYHGIQYDNVMLRLLREPREGSKGWFINVDGTGFENVPQTMFRLRINSPTDFEMVEGNFFVPTTSDPVSELPLVKAAEVETDEDITNRISNRFNILEMMATGVCSGAVRSLIVSGAAGVGKSYTLERVLNESLNDESFTTVKGSITPVSLYQLLHRYSAPNNVVVLDDADSILFDERGLNLLKGALDTNPIRKISWMSQTFEDSDTPNTFEYHGSMVFITNLDFQKIVDENKIKLAPHFRALLTRSLYLDLTLRSEYDVVCWIQKLIHDGMLVREGLTQEQSYEVADYIRQNWQRLRTVSAREALKAAALLKSNPTDWTRIADAVMLR